MDGAQACDRYVVVATGCRHVLSAGTSAHSKVHTLKQHRAVPLPRTLAVDRQFLELEVPFCFQSFCAHANVDVEPQDLSVLLNTSLRAGSSAQRSTMASLSKLVPLTTSVRLSRSSSGMSTSATRCVATSALSAESHGAGWTHRSSRWSKWSGSSTVSPEEVDRGHGSGARMANALDVTMEVDGMIGAACS